MTERCSKSSVTVILLIIGFIILFWIGGYQNNQKNLIVKVQQFNVFNVFGNRDSQNQNEIDSKKQKTCETPECITLAHELHNWGDKNVDPCVDFYKYSCGRYVEHVNSRGILNWKDKVVMNTFAEFMARNESMTTSERLLQKFYGHCNEVRAGRRENSLDEKSLRDLMRNTERIGRWPMKEEGWREEGFDLNEYLGGMAGIGMFDFGVIQFHLNSKIHTVVAGKGISRLWKQKEEIEKVILKLLNNSTSSSFHNDMQNVIKFAHQIDKIAEPEQIAPNRVSFSQLSTDNPKIDFKRLVVALHNSSEHWDTLQTKFTLPDQSVLVGANNGLHRLLEETSPRVQANFLVVYTIMIAMFYTEMNYQNVNCIELTKAILSRSANQWFVTHHFDTENQKLALDLVSRIKAQYLETFEQSTWMHESTKKEAIEKIRKMRTLVAYPEEFAEPGALDRLVEQHLKVTEEDSFYAFRVGIEKWKAKMNLDEVMVDRIFVTGLMTNAMYLVPENMFYLTSSIVSEPLFDASLPESARIASVGYVIGHEIGHGFDPQGAGYDALGNHRDWWHPDDLKEFEKRSQCIIDKYANYDDPSYGKNLNGSVTVGENVADMLGMEAAWKAYKEIDVSKEQRIVGFEDYPSDKLFFQTAAMMYCSPFDTMPLEDREGKDIHGVNNFRVNGPFSNMPQFAEAFNCPIGSPMNPEKKCTLF